MPEIHEKKRTSGTSTRGKILGTNPCYKLLAYLLQRQQEAGPVRLVPSSRGNLSSSKSLSNFLRQTVAKVTILSPKNLLNINFLLYDIYFSHGLSEYNTY